MERTPSPIWALGPGADDRGRRWVLWTSDARGRHEGGPNA